MSNIESASPVTTDLILTDAMVLTMDDSRRAYAKGFVWLRDGRIHQVGSMAEIPELGAKVEQRSAAGHIVMPGLINCHTHLSNAILRGVYDEMPLKVWFSKGMWPVVENLTGEMGEIGSSISLLELMTTGVTTSVSGEIGAGNPELLDGVLTAVERSGIRAIVARIAQDSANEEDPAQFIPEAFRDTVNYAATEVQRLQKRFNSDRVSVVPEAMGVMRCTTAMVCGMHELAQESGCHLTIHAASSQGERDESRRRFGHGTISELGRLGVLGPRTLLAHAIWLDDDEIALLAESGTGVSHNPVANAYYAAGVARLAEMLEVGVRVGLGVDGASTNNSQNVWETMKMAMLFQKQKLENPSFGSAELALELMTRGGAEAIHMEHEIGSLEAGKKADLIVIDTARPSLSPIQNVVTNLVYSNDPWAVRDVYVDGERVVQDGKHLRLDQQAIIANAGRALQPLLEATGLDQYLAERSSWNWQ
jgi:5-methylthioadenosine/S-adenosylhomocysteine deaminase